MPRFKLHSRFALAITIALNAATTQAHASAFDIQGAGPEGVAETGARATRADDGSASFYNPAGLAFGTTTSLNLAPIVSFSALQAQDKPIPIEDPFGISLTASATIPIEGPLKNRLRLGFAGHFLPTTALRLLARAPDQPFYPYYDNRTQRLVAMPALGLRISKQFAIGASVNVLAGVKGPAKLEKGATGSPEPRIDIAAHTIVAANVGIRFDPTQNTRFAIVVRQSFGIPLDIDTTADIGGVPLATNLQSPMAMFDPLTVTVATGFDLGRLGVELNTSYARWSEWSGPFMRVKSTLPGVNLVSRLPDGLFRDTMSFRVGASYAVFANTWARLVLRSGLSLEPTILNGTLQGRTNLADGNKFAAGLGATFVVPNFYRHTLRLGIGASGQFLSSFRQDKQVCHAQPCPDTAVAGLDAANPSLGITNPGYPTLRGSGSVYTLGFGVGVDL